jgi:arabinose-5-phosphate isomerase
MAGGLGETVVAAVEASVNGQGRVVVRGVGTAGHVARPIAAPGASTGSPAHFVHPAEASHGDLGMVTRHDVVIALSNSGEAPELAHLLAYSRRFSIPLIAITSRTEGTLAKQSDITLMIPQLGEACGYGVVPTTSTTMTLALGDALAIAVMKARDFTPENFREFHPGGKLGAQLSRVGDLMHGGDAVPLVGPQTPMSDVLLTISQKGFGVAGITGSDGKLDGIITDGDLRRNMATLLDQTADDVMTKAPRTISETALAEQALSIMNASKITCLFVTGNRGTVTGILHIHDCLRAGVV